MRSRREKAIENMKNRDERKSSCGVSGNAPSSNVPKLKLTKRKTRRPRHLGRVCTPSGASDHRRINARAFPTLFFFMSAWKFLHTRSQTDKNDAEHEENGP